MQAMPSRLVALMILCLPLLDLSSGQLESMGEKRSGNKYCGRYLVQALQVLCNGLYNSPFIPKSKKSMGDLTPSDLMPEGDSVFWLTNSDLEPLAFHPGGRDVGSFHRVTRGIYEECCRNSCTVQQLQMYCARR